MNQRILSCPSSLLTKGLTFKVADWKADNEANETSIIKMQRKPESVASLPNNWKATNAGSSSPFTKQFDIRRVSSSSLASAQTNNSFKQFQSTSAMGNATWDDKAVGGMAAKGTNKGTLSLLDLVSLKTDGSFKKHGMSCTNQGSKSINSVFLEGIATNHTDGKSTRLSRGSSSTNNVFLPGNATAMRTDAKSISLSRLGSLEKVDESLKCSFDSITKNATWDNDLSIAASITYSSLSSDDFSEFIGAKPFAEKPRKQVDIQRISSSDLASLKQSDAFMYYSIPSLRSAMWRDEDVDLSTIKDAALAHKISSTYERKSCISFESCHVPDLASAEFDDMDWNGLSEDDWLISFSELEATKQ